MVLQSVRRLAGLGAAWARVLGEGSHANSGFELGITVLPEILAPGRAGDDKFKFKVNLRLCPRTKGNKSCDQDKERKFSQNLRLKIYKRELSSSETAVVAH